jgi:hypothetical protein
LLPPAAVIALLIHPANPNSEILLKDFQAAGEVIE